MAHIQPETLQNVQKCILHDTWSSINWFCNNTGLLLHFQSHVDKCYKNGLLKTMLHHAYAPSLLRKMPSYSMLYILQLDYPTGLLNATINMFILKSNDCFEQNLTLRTTLGIFRTADTLLTDWQCHTVSPNAPTEH